MTRRCGACGADRVVRAINCAFCGAVPPHEAPVKVGSAAGASRSLMWAVGLLAAAGMPLILMATCAALSVVPAADTPTERVLRRSPIRMPPEDAYVDAARRTVLSHVGDDVRFGPAPFTVSVDCDLGATVRGEVVTPTSGSARWSVFCASFSPSTGTHSEVGALRWLCVDGKSVDPR